MYFSNSLPAPISPLFQKSNKMIISTKIYHSFVTIDDFSLFPNANYYHNSFQTSLDEPSVWRAREPYLIRGSFLKKGENEKKIQWNVILVLRIYWKGPEAWGFWWHIIPPGYTQTKRIPLLYFFYFKLIKWQQNCTKSY